MIVSSRAYIRMLTTVQWGEEQEPVQAGHTCTKRCETLVSWTMFAGDCWGSTSWLDWPDRHNLRAKRKPVGTTLRESDVKQIRRKYICTQKGLYGRMCEETGKNNQERPSWHMHLYTQMHLHTSRIIKSNQSVQNLYCSFNPFLSV